MKRKIKKNPIPVKLFSSILYIYIYIHLFINVLESVTFFIVLIIIFLLLFILGIWDEPFVGTFRN